MLRKTLITLLLILAIGRAAFAADYFLVTLLHTNDLHGNVISARGGLAKAATLVRQIRADMPNVILLDAGDIIHGNYEDYFSGGRATVTAMNATGYAAATTGNHDYDFGPTVLQNAISTASFPMLAANVKDKKTGQPWDKVLPYTILSTSGLKIAVLGLTTQQTISLNWPSTVSEISIDDPFKTAAALVPELRKQADVIVVLSHLGYDVDRKLAASVSGIDFIVGGHTHTVVDKWQWVGDTLVAQTGSNGRYLGRIDFIVEKDQSGAKIASVNGKNGILWNDLKRRPLDKTYPTSPLLEVSPSVPDDAAVLAAYQPFVQLANGVLSEKIGETKSPVTLIPKPSGESPAGDFVADAIRASAKSDIAVIDSASIVAGLNGEIRLRNAFGMIGGWTRQQIITISVKGSDVAAVLSVNMVRRKALRLQFSGLSLTYKVTSNSKADIGKLLVGGNLIDKNKVYTVAGQAYVIQQFMKTDPNAQVVFESTLTPREAIAAFIRSTGTVVPPVMGRLTLNKK